MVSLPFTKVLKQEPHCDASLFQNWPHPDTRQVALLLHAVTSWKPLLGHTGPALLQNVELAKWWPVCHLQLADVLLAWTSIQTLSYI